jgi:hypothetical protein
MDQFVYRSGFGSGRRRWQRGVATLATCAALALPAASHAGTPGEISKQAGLGFASAITSLVYAPLKIVYAAGGLIVGGLAWTFSGGDNEVAKVVLTPSILGDYVVTPKQLVGDEPVEFFGRDPDYAEGELSVAKNSPPADPTQDRVW